VDAVVGLELQSIPQARCAHAARGTARGFVSVEVLASVTVVAIVLLSVATMFLTAYGSVERSGRTTAAVALARHLIEDLRALPFDGLVEFDGLDTGDPSTLPDADPEREIARRWRYALAGAEPGWAVSTLEQQRWSSFADDGAPISGTVEVVTPAAGLRRVTVTLSVQGHERPLRIATLISRTS
jgi:Tfp pilus assembly protein PilV